MPAKEKCGDSGLQSSFQMTSTAFKRKVVQRLPACRVCGGKATGFHYGQNTCGACKGFFRRSITRSEPYTCLGSDNCEIGPNQRRLCSYCRYHKCLSLGMSKSGIKIGRYTSDTRTKITMEVKETQQILTPDEPREKSFEQACVLLSDQPSPVTWQSFDYDEKIRILVEAHARSIEGLSMSDEEIKETYNTYHEEQELRLEIFGPRAPLPKDQYEEIYQTTGIDIDDRQETMGRLLETFEHNLKEYVDFVKNIPEFSGLSIVDQANLIKHATFEFLLLESYRGTNREVILLPKGKYLRCDELYRIYDSDFIDTWLDMCASLGKLNLKHEEVVLLEAICVLFADRCELEAPGEVEKIQWKLIQCLVYLLDKNHQNQNNMFARVMDRLAAMRVVTEMANKVARQTVVWPGVEKYPLYSEIFTA